MPGRLLSVQSGRRWRGSRADAGQSGGRATESSAAPPCAVERRRRPRSLGSARPPRGRLPAPRARFAVGEARRNRLALLRFGTSRRGRLRRRSRV